MLDQLTYLLLQVRNSDDPMRQQEVRSFARVLRTTTARIDVFDLLSGPLREADCRQADVILLGGSGHYSVAQNVEQQGDWLPRALDSLRLVCELDRPVFASCWGFQAVARALGGRVERHPERAEVGTHHLFLTEAGQADPVFGVLAGGFTGQMGHEDHVVELPPDAVLLASSNLVQNQAYRLADRPVYCTQFHPELNRSDLVERVNAYPRYVEEIAGQPFDEFLATVSDTPDSERLLSRFAAHAAAGRPLRTSR